jgi:hypothetical protein
VNNRANSVSRGYEVLHDCCDTVRTQPLSHGGDHNTITTRDGVESLCIRETASARGKLAAGGGPETV